MKILFEHVIWLLTLIIYSYICVADNGHKRQIQEEEYQSNPSIPIGAFFHEESTQARLVFDYMFYRTANKPDSLNYQTRIETVSLTDTFESGQLVCDMMEKGVGAIIGPSSAQTAPIVEYICLNMEIPVLQVNWRPSTPPNYINPNTVINIFPRPDLLVKGIGVIAKNLHWKTFTILYQNSEGLVRIQDVLKLQSFTSNFKQNDIFIKELGPGPDFKSVLKEVKKLKERRIVLDCDADKIIPILSQAKEIKLLESYMQYFITSLDAHTVDLSVLDIKANITTIRIIDPEDSNFISAVRDWQRYNDIKGLDVALEPYSIKTETALMYDALNLFMEAASEYQPIYTETLHCFEENRKQWRYGVPIALTIQGFNGTGISGPIEFDPFGRRTNFTIYLVEGNRNDTQATWNPSNGDSIVFILSEEDRIMAQLRHIVKDTLIVSSRIQAPYLREKKGPVGPGINDKYEGFSLDLMLALAEEMKPKFNITMKFEVPKGLGYGQYVEENKTWDGIIGEILANRAQLGICDLTITHQRREVVDFSSPFMRLGISILHKKAEEKNVSTFAFLEPFNIDLWIYTATLYLVITVVSFFISRLSPEDWENPNPKDTNPTELENIWDLKNCLWLSLGTIMNQGCDLIPKGFSSRMVATMYWFFAIIVTNSYMANLTAFLTVSYLESTIQSAEDLAKQTKIKYGLLKGGSSEAFFRDSNYSTYQKMWAAMLEAEPTVFEKSNEDGVNRVLNTKNGLYAYLMESTTLEYSLYTKCELRKVGDPLDSKGYGIAMPLDYPLRTPINAAILSLQEKGKIKKLYDKWWKENRDEPTCPPPKEEADAAKLSLRELRGIFLVLAVGVALAYVVAIFEFLWNVRNVSVDEHITYWEALKSELLFAVCIWITRKKAKPVISESSSSSSHSDGFETKSRSIARNVLQSAGSLFGLDVIKTDSLPREKTD